MLQKQDTHSYHMSHQNIEGETLSYPTQIKVKVKVNYVKILTWYDMLCAKLHACFFGLMILDLKHHGMSTSWHVSQNSIVH
jgi:hypothetical protein